MKKILLNSSKVLADAAMSVTRANVNSICYAFLHQPKLPESCKKLKK